MQILNNCAIDLRVRNPDRVMRALPEEECRYVGEQEDGLHRILVRWHIDNVRFLANMGFANGNVPSPIEHNYSWPGIYTPFDHQRRTAGFLTANDRCYCFDEQGCVDSETEYLTPHGWLKISDYTGGRVGQFNPNTKAVEFVAPEAYVKLPCRDMIRFKTKNGVDQLLSPEHRMLISSNKADKQAVMSAAAVLQSHNDYHAGAKRPYIGKKGCKDIAFSSAAIPAVFTLPGGQGLLLSDEELRVQVAVIADGHFGSMTNWCVVRVKKERKVHRLQKLLTAANIEFKETTPEYKTAKGFRVFKFYAPRREKFFNAQWWDCSQAQREIISEEVIHWDGADITNKGDAFFSTSSDSADFIQMVWTSCGYIARVTPDTRAGRTTCYTVYRRKKSSGLLSLRGSTATARAAASTDGFKYCFTVPSTFLVFRRNGCVFASGNTGKTASVIWAADYLMELNQVSRVLIICPMSIMQSAWEDELFKLVMHRSVGVAHGLRKKRTAIIESAPDYTIINYDGIPTVLAELEARKFDLIIADECTAVKTATTNRWKAVNNILEPDTRLWMLTGTPAAQSPLDAFGLAKMNTPTRVPKYYGAWRDKVMLRVSQFKWVPKSNATSLVHNALQPAIRHTKSECLDLPPITYVKREVPLTPQQKKYYHLMKTQMRMQAAGELVTAVHAASLLQKLLQLSCGAVYDDAGGVIQFDAASRLNVMMEVIEDTDHKVIVFVPFRHAIDIVSAHIRKKGYTVEVINGSVPAGKRHRIFKSFQEADDPHVLVIQPQSAAHGVTLTAADTIIWFGPTNSVETWLQANERINRPSQENKMTVTKLTGSQVEEKVYNALESKETTQRNLVALYESELQLN